MDDEFNAQTEHRLIGEMRRALGETVRFTVHKAPRLPQEKNGKYRFSICKVDTLYQPAAR
jgi:phenylacetate-CoA ligase